MRHSVFFEALGGPQGLVKFVVQEIKIWGVTIFGGALLGSLL